MPKKKVFILFIVLCFMVCCLGCLGESASDDEAIQELIQEAFEEGVGTAETKEDVTSDVVDASSDVVSVNDVSPDITTEGSKKTDESVGEGSEIATVLGCIDETALNYNELATEDDGSCEYCINGCTNLDSQNYNANATCDDGSCIAHVLGCTDKNAMNYNSSATKDDESCKYCTYGCMDKNAQNHNANATCDDGSCIAHVLGCMDENAMNYNSSATKNDGSCEYCVYGCMDRDAKNYNRRATCDDDSCTYRVVDSGGSSGGGGGGSSSGGSSGSVTPPVVDPPVVDPPIVDPPEIVCTCWREDALNTDLSGDCSDDSLCTYPDTVCTCQDESADNCDMAGDCRDDSLCEYRVGCRDASADNYDELAIIDCDGCCIDPPLPDNQGFLLIPLSGKDYSAKYPVLFAVDESIIPDGIGNNIFVYSNIDGLVGNTSYHHLTFSVLLSIGTHILTSSARGIDTQITIEVKEFDDSNWGLDTAVPWPIANHDLQGSCKGDYPGSDVSNDRWEISVNAFEVSQVIIGHNVAFVNEDDGVTCFNLVDGSQIWKFAQTGFYRYSPITLSADSRGYVSAVEEATQKVYGFAINSDTGELIWKTSDIALTYKSGAKEVLPSPSPSNKMYTSFPQLLDNGQVLFGCQDEGMQAPDHHAFSITKAKRLSHEGQIIMEEKGETGRTVVNEDQTFRYYLNRDRMCVNPTVRFTKSDLTRRRSDSGGQCWNVSEFRSSITVPGFNAYHGPITWDDGQCLIGTDKTLILMEKYDHEIWDHNVLVGTEERFQEVWRQTMPVHRFLVDKDNNRALVVEGGTGLGLTARSLADGSVIAGFANNVDFDDCFGLAMDALGKIYGVSVSGITCASTDGVTLWKVSRAISDQGSVALGNGIMLVIAGNKLICFGN